MRKKRVFQILLIVVLLISIFVWRKVVLPQNIFEEIYQAEMNRAKKGENTVLSGSEYFEVNKATISTWGRSKDLGEKAKETSNMNLGIGSKTELLGSHYEYVQIAVGKNIEDYSVHFFYIYSTAGKSPNLDYGIKGLHIEWEVREKNDTSFNREKEVLVTQENVEDLDKYGLDIEKVGELGTECFQEFVKVWLDAYPKSRFSMKNIGKFEAVYFTGFGYFSNDREDTEDAPKWNWK
jgi:hypothetical protein